MFSKSIKIKKAPICDRVSQKENYDSRSLDRPTKPRESSFLHESTRLRLGPYSPQAPSFLPALPSAPQAEQTRETPNPNPSLLFPFAFLFLRPRFQS